jgi:hypothetical protein
MRAADLITAIQKAGGQLTPEVDGQLLCRGIPVEYRDELKLLKAEVIPLLLAPATAVTPVTVTPKISKGTPCGNPLCRHNYGDHCESGRQHGPTDDGLWPWFSCISRHCLCGLWMGFWCPCPCEGFVNPYTTKVTTWKRKVEVVGLGEPTPPFPTPCVACGHVRAHHCKESKYALGIWVEHKLYFCQHWQRWVEADSSDQPCCTSTACAENVDGRFCDCQKFVSPCKKGAARKPGKRSTAGTLLLPLGPAAEEAVE